MTKSIFDSVIICFVAYYNYYYYKHINERYYKPIIDLFTLNVILYLQGYFTFGGRFPHHTCSTVSPTDTY